MTPLMISDELASAITGKAADRTCTTEELLQTLLSQMESDEEFAERMLRPEIRSRFANDLARVDQGEFFTEEQTDQRFEAMFRELESR